VTKSVLAGDFDPYRFQQIETKCLISRLVWELRDRISGFRQHAITYGGNMQRKTPNPFLSLILMLILVSVACSTSAPPPTSTSTPEPTTTNTAVPTNTPRPSPTPRPTKTPNLAATQRTEELNAEAQEYFEKGYLATTNGRFRELEDFTDEWAQLGWYQWLSLDNKVSDFFMSAHFEWDSAYRNSDTSGCGFIFAIQPNNDHYAVFLDRSEVLFLVTDTSVGYSKPVGKTRGTGRIKFDYPAEADFTLIVKGAYAYVLVDGEVVGEYTLSQSRPMRGNLGLTILSGTNKDYGTRCSMTDLHLWIPNGG